MKHTFKRAMSLFMALAMVLTMVPSFGTHVHAEELETEPVVVTEEPATEAPVVEVPVEEVPETEAPTQAPETEAPATEAPTEPATEAPEIVETEAPEVTEEAPEVVETEPTEETEAAEETFPDETEETIPEEILEEEIVEEEAVMAGTLNTISGLTATWTDASNANGSASWSASGTGITGTATGYVTAANMGRSVKTTLTLKNTSGSEAKLSFTYSLTNGGSATITDSESNSVNVEDGVPGNYAKDLATNESITIELKSSAKKNPAANELAITGLALVSTSAAPVTTTFKPAAEGGSYSVNGEEVTAEMSEEVVAGTTYKLEAVAAEGYRFFAWYDMATGSCLDYGTEYTYTATNDGAEIVAKFVSTSTALFGVGAAKFYSLSEAGAFAANGDTKLIVLLNDGVVSGNHTIPAGTTLLVPFDNKNTVYTDVPECTNTDGQNTATWVQPTAYRTLELASDASITVDGSISISAKHFAGGSGANAASPTESVGVVKMAKGSKITLNSGASLYAWGFITGSGTITAKSGSKVYENFQIRDFRGGGATSSMATEFIVFPMSQYYVQNIEVPVTFEYGAEEYVYTSLYMSSKAYSAGVKFIGDKAMFRPEEGCRLTKDYIESKDRLKLTVEGTASLASLTLEIEGVAEIDSSMFILPINSNISIEILSGTTTLAQDIALLPGVEMTIAKGAVLSLASGDGSATIESGTGHNLFVYDVDEWAYGLAWNDEIEDVEVTQSAGYVYPNSKFIALTYAPGRTYTRTVADLKDVKIDINGTLVTNGFLYTTAGGANITSSEGTGVLAMNSGAGVEMFTYQAVQVGTNANYYAIPITSAQLKNGDDTYLQTIVFDENGEVVTEGTAQPGTTYTYCAYHEAWHDYVHPPVEITWANLGFAADVTEEFDFGAKPEYKGNTPTKASDATNHYTFAGWSKTRDGEVLSELPAVTEDTVFYAVFTSEAHNGTDDGDCTSEVMCSCGYVTIAAKAAHVAGEDDGDCTTAIKCVNCDKIAVEAKAAHVAGEDDGDCTTAVKCVNCEKDAVEAKTHVDGDDKNHDCDNCSATNVDDGCYGGTAYCNAKAICDECGQPYGEKDPSNHASDEVTKVFKDSEYHTVTHTCCGTPEVVEHDSGDFTCSCGGISFYVMFDEESVELISFTSGGVAPDGSFIDPSKPVTVEAKNKVGSGVIIMYIDTDNPQGFPVESYSGTLEIPADKINPNARLRVYIDATVNVTIQLNGGSIPEAVKAEMLAMGITVTDSAFVYPAVYNGGDWCSIAELVAYDGHSIESVTDKDGKNYYYVDVEEVGPEIVLKNLTEDLELTINWTCDELTDVAEVPATCGADGVKAYKVCACDKAYDANGKEIADLEAWKKADGKINATGEHVDGDDDNHDCDNCDATNVDEGHAGGTATCLAAAVCAECGETYGEKNPNNHTGKTTAVDNEDGKTHKLVCECGETTVTSAPHIYVNGICVCEAKQTFTITFDDNVNGARFYISADRNYVDTLPVTVTYGGAAKAFGVGEADADGKKVWSINNDKKVLSGWNTKADGTGKHYAIGAEIKPTGDMTLYAIWKEVSVGGVGLNSGEYLDLNGNVTTTMPEGGYAYYNNGTLTLNNYSYTGEGYMHQISSDMTAAVYGRYEDLTIVLVGENRLKNTFSMGYDSAVYADNLTILGEGTLTGEASGYGLKADIAIKIQGGSLNLTANWAVYSYGTVTVSGGTVTGNGQGFASKGWAFENNVTILEPQDGNAGENGYLCGANGSPARSFKLARAYTVTFLDKDGKQIGEAQTVEHGESATAPTAPDVTGYTFDKWDKDFTEVTSDLTVQALYKVNEYKLTVNVLANGKAVELTVPYGANLLEVLAAAAEEDKIPAIGNPIPVNIPNDHIGYSKPAGYAYQNPEYGDWSYVDDNMTMPADDLEINQTFRTYGWFFTDPDGDEVYGAEYYLEGYGYLTGWQFVEEDFDDVEGGAWYYFDTVNMNDAKYYFRAEGITRVPYPTETINGITYAPNKEDLEYAEEHNKTFLDKDTGLFVFGDDGKFQQNHSGVSEYEGENRKVTNGLIEWHPGVVDLAQYLYFIGDEEVGGNKLATGDVYVARNSTSRKFVIGGVYTFSESGPLCEYDGITEVNGKLRYYEDAQLMLGKGLTKVGENYIYVRSNGELVVNNSYWVGENDLNVVPGLYSFDENGYMIDPAPTDKNGVFAEDGGLYYYENGKRTYAGLIEYNGGIIYVTSSGKLATGKYWVTKTNDMDDYDPGFYFFDEDGYMEQERNGIVPGKDENGNDVLYYYENNQIKYNAGLIKYDEQHLIYVRSNGQLAIGTYWITNTNGLKDAGCYEFDSEGFLQVDKSLNGVVGLNYYIDGIKQFGNGLVQVEGGYIYVKTNGELATGTYWITRTNGLKDAGCYEFGADGYMILG